VGKDRHSAKLQVNKFCAKVPCVPDSKCPAGTEVNYIKVCEPEWLTFEFHQKDGPKKYEAHHILCFSCIAGEMFLGSKNSNAVLEGTKWCVNNKENMIALPLWGHTVKWYATPFKGVPEFKDLPNHNRDHPRYLNQVLVQIQQIVKDVQIKKNEHDVDVADIATELDDLAKDFRQFLDDCGHRAGIDSDGKVYPGTDECIALGRKEEDSTWYMPFSMAKVPKPRHFPSVFNKKWNDIKKWQEALLK
jgi:hypothetical protein